MNAFVGHIVDRAYADGVKLKPADVARRAADHLAGNTNAEPGSAGWRDLDDYGRDLEVCR